MIYNVLKCSQCQTDLIETKFPVNRTKPNRHHRGHICLQCQKAYKKTLNYQAVTHNLTCIKCNVEQDCNQFSKNKRVPKGRNSTCKTCTYERAKYRKAVKESILNKNHTLESYEEPKAYG